MRAFAVFIKKELLESVRTYRFVITVAVFVLMGILSPLTALMLPRLLETMDLGEFAIILPEPTAMDAWAQFFSNVGTMGMLVVIILFSGIMANEFSRGTLVNLLTKGLNRTTVIAAKFVAASLVWTLAYLVCLGVTMGYVVFYWEVNLQNPVLAFMSLWLFGELLIAILILGGTLFGSFGGGLALAGGMIVILMLLNIIPNMASYNPISLAGSTLTLLDGGQVAGDFVPAMIICGGMIIMFIVLSIVVFRKKKM